MVGIIVSLLMGFSSAQALDFDAPAPSKLRCRLSGANIVLGMHSGKCSGKGGAKYSVDIVGLGASLGLNAGYFRLKSLDGPFQDVEKISAARYGLAVGISGQMIRGYRVKGKEGEIRGWMAGLGLGFTFDHVGIKLNRIN